MREVPDCLNRRYQALDRLMTELCEKMSDHSVELGNTERPTIDPAVKLMCKFWHILKEDPDCDLQQLAKQMVAVKSRHSGVYQPQHVTCLMATGQDDSRESSGSPCCDSKCSSDENKIRSPEDNGSGSKQSCCDVRRTSTLTKIDITSVSKVLCNLNQAASFDKKCTQKIKTLTEVQNKVSEQIQNLEEREKEGAKMLKQADCMWACMENTYKQKIAKSLERQAELAQQQKEVEASLSKWRMNKKDLEFQMKNLNKFQQEIKEKTHQKKSDLQCIDLEIADLKKRHQTNLADIEKTKKSFNAKKQASEARMAVLNAQLQKLQENVVIERKIKEQKELEGSKYLKEAREDLQKLCRVLLQKKLENEDLKTECVAILGEIDLLKQTMDQCKDKCKNKENALRDEMKRVSEEIANFKIRCTKCHACTDTTDARKLCTDCPRCQEVRECLYSEGSCVEDPTAECVCMSIKEKFLNNVFENMYMLLERQIQTNPGQVLADQVVDCLKKSRNGKLNDETRSAIHDFVLTTVKKNLNLTVIGGAVKTRCEMDPDTYNQLMLCLKNIKATKPKPVKVDKGTAARKDPCRRWGGNNECNCPKGPKACVCTKKAPPPPKDPTPCPQLEEDKHDIGESAPCPHNDKVLCGPDCGKLPDAVKELVTSWKRDPCAGSTCTFSQNMRAVQCMLKPRSLNAASKPKGYMPTIPFESDLNDEMKSNCECGPDKSCTCHRDNKQSRKTQRNEKGDDSFDLTSNNKVRKQTQQTPIKRKKVGDTCDCSLFYQKISEESNNVNKMNIDKKIVKNTDDKIQRGEASTESVESTIEEAYLNKLKDREVSLLQPEVMSQAYKECGTDPLITKRQKEQENALENVVSSEIQQSIIRDLFKVAISNESGDEDLEFTQITTTSSGSIKMALDEKTIKLIDSSTKDDPNLYVLLKKTLSGHFVVEFNKSECDSTASRRIIVNRTDSGSLLMEVHKDLVNAIQPNIIKAINVPPKSSVSVGVTTKMKARQSHQQVYVNEKDINNKDNFAYKFNKKNINNKLIEEKKGNHDISTHVIKRSKRQSNVKNDMLGHKSDALVPEANQQISGPNNNYSEQNIDSHTYFEAELKTMFENNDTAVDVTIVGDNGMEFNLNAEVIQTQSKHMAIDIKSMVYVGQLANQLKEYPVLLSKIKSKYIINVSQNTDIANAVLRRTSAGDIYVVLKNLTSVMFEYGIALLESKEQLFKVRVQGVQPVHPEPSFVMKATPSGNYVFVLEKEFEKRYLKTVNEFVSDDSECPVKLFKTDSGCYVIDFEECLNREKNAVLTKSNSGNIKMLVKGSAFDALHSAPSSLDKSSVIFGELFKQLPPSSREFHRENLAKSKFLKKKSFSASQLHDQLRIQNHTPLLTEPSAVLKKTKSGQYAVVLNKESKASFINGLKNYLSNSVQGLIPIRKTDEGDIIINLNHEQESKTHYGSLKITPSGNIFVLIDESVIKEIDNINANTATRTASTIMGDSSPSSVHVIGTVVHPKSKGVTTSCHGKPESCSCDESKCVCKELCTMESLWLNKKQDKSSCSSRHTEFSWNQVKRNPDGSYKTCDPSTCEESCASRSRKTFSTDSQHFHQEKGESSKVRILHVSHAKPDNNLTQNEQCYYVIDTDCLIHKDFERLIVGNQSQDPKSIADSCHHDFKSETGISQCSVIAKCVSDVKEDFEADLSNSDYLEYLPPQLPFFLRN